jgi:hypothetical protein
MKKSVCWAPAPNPKVLTVERHEVDFTRIPGVVLIVGDFATFPHRGRLSKSRRL